MAEAEPNQPMLIDYPTQVDALGTMLAFGTTERAVSSLFLEQ